MQNILNAKTVYKSRETIPITSFKFALLLALHWKTSAAVSNRWCSEGNQVLPGPPGTSAAWNALLHLRHHQRTQTAPHASDSTHTLKTSTRRDLELFSNPMVLYSINPFRENVQCQMCCTFGKIFSLKALKSSPQKEND